ncbi:MAG: MFS transporter [Candidatus Omnitrophica bacterium]|nr:MFS transporter [Candidatus Omnitrophota bacterium]
MVNIILLGITSLLTDISTEMVYPVLPIFLVSQLGASPAILGVIEGVAESLASLLKVFSGYLSDKVRSRKPFAIVGYASSTIGKVCLYIAAHWHVVFLGRLIDRFGKGIRTAPRDALIADSTPEGKRGAAFGLHRAMDTLGAACGVLLAYWIIQHYHGDLKKLFLFSLIPAIMAVVALFFVKEAKHKLSAANKQIRFSWKGLDKRLKLFLIVSFVFTLGNSSNQFLLLRAQQIGNPLTRVLLLYLVYNLVYAALSFPAAKLSDTIGRKYLLVAGYLLYAIVYVGFALSKSGEIFWLLFILYGLYMACTEGIEKALLVDIAPVQVRATTIGLHATIVGLGLLPASVLAGALWSLWGPAAPFYFGATMAFITSISFYFILRKRAA